MHHPLGNVSLGSSTQLATSGFIFIDYGYTRPYRPPGSTMRSYEQLTSSGVGINATLGKHIPVVTHAARTPRPNRF